jgi:hypothetical protein
VSAKEKILKTLVEKMRNAWFRAEVEAWGDRKTKHGGTNHSGILLQGGLKGTKVRFKVNDDLKLKEE